MDYEVVINSTLRLGMQAPDFEANTTCGNVKLSEYKGKWVVFFSHPADFTPVCTTEILAFQKMIKYFEERNTQLLGLSVDSNPSHLAWLKNIKDNTGVEITFPLIADKDMSIARRYGMIAPEVANTETVRNVYIIDDKQVIRTILMYPMTNGRYIPEIIRIIDSLQITDKENVSTPANWVPGNPVVVPSPKQFCNINSNVDNERLTCVDWYLCFKKLENQSINKNVQREINSKENVK